MKLAMFAGLGLFLAAVPVLGDVLTLEIKPPVPPGQARYMGAGAGSLVAPAGARSPSGSTIGYDNLSLLKDGKPWLPVMGEFHFSRYPANEWREELLKMKAGGIGIVATYVFWIHHEEVQGQFDWVGQKNLKEFVRLCGEVGIPVIVRMGPWCHGEVRNGGMPDWADAMPRKRSADAAFLAAVRPLYAQIADQVKGQLWKDGGPVIGIQVDNEFGGAPAYLLALKNMAREVGMDVPIYTRTGWPAPRSPYPYGELMPLFGGYAEGFWDRTLDLMPGNYWQAFTFSTERIDTAIASDIFGQQEVGGEAARETLSYPWLTCELGGGMMSSYHRRIKIDPMDVLSIPLTKVGAGSNLPGYYMYHGGTNPDGKTTGMMQETQSRGMWNDLPYKTYDFQAPLGEYGQVRESYHLLRQFHLFLQDFGPELARMTPTFPAIRHAKNNAADLRYAVRSDGKSGFLFVNNYQRGMEMGAKPDTRFVFKLGGLGDRQIPGGGGGGSTLETVTIPANGCFVWPFNLDLGGTTLRYATAQPICKFQDGETTYSVFLQTPGVESEFVFDRDDVVIDATSGTIANGEATVAAWRVKPGLTPAIQARHGVKRQVIYLLSGEMAVRPWRASLAGKERLILSGANLVFDGGTLRATSNQNPVLTIIPPVSRLAPIDPIRDAAYVATFTQTQQAGPLRQIKRATTQQPVAEHPVTADFEGEQPAIFRIKLPAQLAALDKDARALLRLHYVGDVARVYAGNKLITDNYYNGDPMDVGLWRLPAGTTELTLKVFPLQKGAPIYLAKWPDMQGKESIATLSKVEVIVERTIAIDVK